MAARPLRLMAGWGLLGAVGGLIAAALVVGSGTLLTLFWYETSALALLGSAVGMASVICWPAALFRVLSWHVVATGAVQFALMMTAGLLLGDAILDQRGVHVTAAVSDVREITTKDGGTGYVCTLRLPDGTSAEPVGWDTGCDEDTRTGTRLTVHQDPEGLVPPQRSLKVTAPQYAWLVGGGAATLVALSALAGVHAAGRRQS